MTPTRRGVLLLEIVWLYLRVRGRLIRRQPLVEIVRDLRETQAKRTFLADEAARLGIIVQRSLSPLPFDTRCLTQSLVLVGLLARRGRSSVLVIAADPGTEFGAHAWVEHRGKPVLPAWPNDYRLVTL